MEIKIASNQQSLAKNIQSQIKFNNFKTNEPTLVVLMRAIHLRISSLDNIYGITNSNIFLPLVSLLCNN
ncbi:hypothetical protein EGI31_07950 [Lacihabitans soyangensis]|uniref:Uncharacterized protein n=1 Tax=Lacihabitans soyangensis TaxID=869394 RepID=A0AAE3H0V7_9BACT|nr:hypothetical protein [Lacihabitans soyangensis]